MRPNIQGQQSIGELPDGKDVCGLVVLPEGEVPLHISVNDNKDLNSLYGTLRIYFLMERLRLRVPCKALTNKLIHSSKVPSKLDFTVASSTPSRGEKVLMICRTRQSNLVLMYYPKSWLKIEKSFSRRMGASLCRPASQLLLIWGVSVWRERKNSMPAVIIETSSD